MGIWYLRTNVCTGFEEKKVSELCRNMLIVNISDVLL